MGYSFWFWMWCFTTFFTLIVIACVVDWGYRQFAELFQKRQECEGWRKTCTDLQDQVFRYETGPVWDAWPDLNVTQEVKHKGNGHHVIRDVER